jgi:glycosyltransferase involved in cell wall biosynthesis
LIVFSTFAVLNMMKVLAVTSNYPSLSNPVDGVFVHRLYKELKKYVDIKVVLMVPGFGFPRILAKYSLDGVDVMAVQYFRPRGRMFNSVEGVFALSAARILLGLFRDFDLIHGHWQVETGPLCMLLSKYKGIPFLISVRGGNIFSKSKHSVYAILSRIVFANADRIHTHGENIFEFLQEKFNVNKDKLVFIPNVVDYNEHLEQVGLKDMHEREDVNILFVGIDSKRKGLKDAVVAFNRLNIEANVFFTIITDDRTAYFRKHIHGLLSGNERILVRQPVRPEYVYPYYQDADIFIFPSINEGVPNALIEAMAAGCYIVCYDIPGVKGIIRHRVNGRLVQVGDISGLENELRWYLENRHSPDVLSYRKYNREFLAGYYDTDANVKSYLTMYANLAAGGK